MQRIKLDVDQFIFDIKMIYFPLKEIRDYSNANEIHLIILFI